MIPEFDINPYWLKGPRILQNLGLDVTGLKFFDLCKISQTSRIRWCHRCACKFFLRDCTRCDGNTSSCLVTRASWTFCTPHYALWWYNAVRSYNRIRLIKVNLISLRNDNLRNFTFCSTVVVNQHVSAHSHSENIAIPLQWRHNEPNGVSNHQPHHCFLNRLFRCRSKKT